MELQKRVTTARNCHSCQSACKLAKVAVLASYGSTKFLHDAILSITQKVDFQTCPLHMNSSHAHAFYHPLLMVAAFEVLTESLSIQHLVAHDC